MGLWKMAEVSGLGLTSMMTTARNCLRLETVRAANDISTNSTAKLPAFHLDDIQHTLHSSSDGQCMETQVDPVDAWHSPKYFGLQQGVSAYTLVAKSLIGTSTKVITCSACSTTIPPALNQKSILPILMVQTRSFFWILHTFGYRFAPRYRDLHKRMDTLVGFKDPTECGNFLIKPSRKTYEELIEKEWPNIQGIMASLAEGGDAGYDCSQTRQPRPAKPGQESFVGTGEYLPHTIYPRIHRRC